MIRVGILGCGSIVKYRHAPEYSMNENVELVGFYDPRLERAAEMAEKFGGRAFESAKELLDCPDIDAVSVCSCNVYHYEQTMAALANGKHVLCEKPMATSVEMAEEMCALARKTGKKLMIAENFRVANAHVKAKQLIEAGEIGDIQTFRAVFGHNGPENWTADKSVDTWFFQKDKCFCGSVGDLGVHKIDAMRWLLGAEVSEVSAVVATLEKKDKNGRLIDVDDNTIALLRFTNGVFGSLQSSWTIKGDEDHSTVIYGSTGTMRIYDAPGADITVVNEKGEKASYQVGTIPTNGDGGQFKTGIIDAFIDCILKDKEPLVNARNGVEDVRIVENILKAAETKTVVRNQYVAE